MANGFAFGGDTIISHPIFVGTILYDQAGNNKSLWFTYTLLFMFVFPPLPFIYYSTKRR